MYLIDRKEIEDITRWREDMNFMFEWQEQYLTSERSERVRYCLCHDIIGNTPPSCYLGNFDFTQSESLHDELILQNDADKVKLRTDFY